MLLVHTTVFAAFSPSTGFAIRDLKIQDGSEDDGRPEVIFPYEACALQIWFVFTVA